MNSKVFRQIFFLFVSWKFILLCFLFIAIQILPNQTAYLGGGLENYLRVPCFWSWANFDGEHYLAIAQYGYRPLTYFFFPLFPLVLNLLSKIFGTSQFSMVTIGLIFNNLAFLLSMVGLYKLLRLDYEENRALNIILLILIFPTSFYFSALYTESLFLLTVVWSFYFSRKRQWLLAGMLGSLASSTRIVGIVLLPCLLFEYWQQIQFKKQKVFNLRVILSLLLIPLGLILYMLYLNNTTGDYLAFFHNLSIFGGQRSSELIILPQVFYRYFFKILPNVNYNYIPVAFTTILETLVGCLFLGLSISSFWKVRLSYALFLTLGYLIPPLSGSFSSLPRYVVILFPAFIVFSYYLEKLPRFARISVYILLIFSLGIATSLFTRGYWVS